MLLTNKILGRKDESVWLLKRKWGDQGDICMIVFNTLLISLFNQGAQFASEDIRFKQKPYRTKSDKSKVIY